MVTHGTVLQTSSGVIALHERFIPAEVVRASGAEASIAKLQLTRLNRAIHEIICLVAILSSTATFHMHCTQNRGSHNRGDASTQGHRTWILMSD
jgi:hypothetical protein